MIWFHGYDFLNPELPVLEPEISIPSMYDKVKQTPGRFYWSPFGQFVITTLLYALFLVLFCIVTMNQLYDYKGLPTDTGSEILLWIFAVGYVAYEVVEFIGDPGDYFSQMSNLFDILISLNWMMLLALRANGAYVKEKIYDESGTIDYNAMRQETTTILFMAFWSFQCILMWTRVITIFKVCVLMISRVCVISRFHDHFSGINAGVVVVKIKVSFLQKNCDV